MTAFVSGATWNPGEKKNLWVVMQLRRDLILGRMKPGREGTVSERRMLRLFGSSIPKFNGERVSICSREQKRHTVLCGKTGKKKRETLSEKWLYITVTFTAVQSDDGRILGLKNCGVAPLLAKQTPYLIAFLNQQDWLWVDKPEYGNQFVTLSTCWKYIVLFAILWSRFSCK